MAKLLFIAWKDTRLRLRDPLALVFPLVGPLVIVLILGIVFGRNRLEPVATLIVNQDEGQLGRIYVQALTSPEVSNYVKATVLSDADTARVAVERGEAVAAVILPAHMTQAIFSRERQQVEIYADPAETIGPQVVSAIVNAISLQIARNAATVQTSLALLLKTGRITVDQQATIGAALGVQMQAEAGSRPPILSLAGEDLAARAGSAALAYYAPAMLVFFLMLNGVRSGPHLLEEKSNRTLDRLLTAPLQRSTVIMGKLLGDVALTAVQAILLVAGLSLFFKVDLGRPLSVALVLTSYILAVTALGLMLGGIARTNESAGMLTQGAALVLGLLGGAFTSTDQVPVLNVLRIIAPNSWALDGLLQSGSSDPNAILPAVGILLLMTGVFTALGAYSINQKLSEAG
jgi:ABC-2 type transport system permease protein